MTDDPITPELVLIDPSLRDRLLADAPLADPPPAPLERLRKTTKSDVETLLEQIPARTEPGDGSASYRRRLTVPLVVAVLSSLLTLGAVAAVLELRAGDGPSAVLGSTSSQTPASLPQSTPTSSTTTQHSPTSTHRRGRHHRQRRGSRASCGSRGPPLPAQRPTTSPSTRTGPTTSSSSSSRPERRRRS